MTPQDLMNHFGTRRAVCEFFGISNVSLGEWIAKGEVPIGRQYEAQVRTAGRLVAIQPLNTAPPAPSLEDAA